MSTAVIVEDCARVCQCPIIVSFAGQYGWYGMDELTVDLHISMAEFEAYYAGAATSVQARDIHGRRVRFPARILRSCLRHNGVHGRFVIRFDAQKRFRSIRQITQE